VRLAVYWDGPRPSKPWGCRADVRRRGARLRGSLVGWLTTTQMRATTSSSAVDECTGGLPRPVSAPPAPSVKPPTHPSFSATPGQLRLTGRPLGDRKRTPTTSATTPIASGDQIEPRLARLPVAAGCAGYWAGDVAAERGRSSPHASGLHDGDIEAIAAECDPAVEWEERSIPGVEPLYRHDGVRRWGAAVLGVREELGPLEGRLEAVKETDDAVIASVCFEAREAAAERGFRCTCTWSPHSGTARSCRRHTPPGGALGAATGHLVRGGGGGLVSGNRARCPAMRRARSPLVKRKPGPLG
jgi:hypothetical protein